MDKPHFIVQITHSDGDVVFVGTVPLEAVEIQKFRNRPTTASIKLPAEDMLASLNKRIHTSE